MGRYLDIGGSLSLSLCRLSNVKTTASYPIKEQSLLIGEALLARAVLVVGNLGGCGEQQREVRLQVVVTVTTD